MCPTNHESISEPLNIITTLLVLAEDDNLDFEERGRLIQSDISCHSSGEVQWKHGERLYNLLRNVSINSGRDEFHGGKKK